LNYTGVLSSNLFVEATLANRNLKFVNSGAATTDIIDGTLVIDVPYNGEPALVQPVPGAKQALDRAEKDGEVGKDDVTGAEKRLDGITKKHTDAVDELLSHKEAELLEV